MIDSARFKLPEWFVGEGPDSDVVISSRVRLARNIDGRPFPPALSGHARAKIDQELRRVLESRKERYTRLDMHSLDTEERRMLVESNTLGPSEAEWGDSLYLSESREVRIHVNALDHLRLVGFAPGLDLQRLRGLVDEVEEFFDEALVFAVSLRMGYFTADMRDVGTGLRATALLHLPALSETGGLAEALRAVDDSVVKYEIFPANTRVSLGDLILLSNARAMGDGEGAIVENVEGAVSQLVHYEREARGMLLDSRGDGLRHSARQALKDLQGAGAIDGETAAELISRLRLATVSGLIRSPGLGEITSLYFLSQPSLIGQGSDGEGFRARGASVDERRAVFLKQQLESLL